MCFDQNFLKKLDGCNHVISCSKLPIKTIWTELFYILITSYEKRTISIEPHYLFTKMLLKGNMENFLKTQREMSDIVFLSKLLKKAVWVESYCLLVKIF